MPRRNDINNILILGSGPIVIGQGCEFDYSGTQACKALREEGYRVVLVNSNPATIMTDPMFSDRTYIEPITPEAVRKIIAKEKELGSPIDALLPTLGGQTALNCACALFDEGTLSESGIEMIGATRDVIYKAEDREEFRRIVDSIGLKQANAATVTSLEDAWTFLKQIGLPAIIRPAFTLGGTGSGIAYNRDEFEDLVRLGLDASMIGQVLIDESALGWKEYELEVIRDRNDNCIVVCGIENIDAMGVHTGDSITVAPIMTLSDKEYQRMRDSAFAIMRAVGVDTGGSNVQFAVNPKNGEQIVIEMNPRVSRSSALASKATGFPIAKIAAKLAVGFLLHELPNDITRETMACFEPTIDYVVTKAPRFAFEKFPEADPQLTTQMKSVGETMAIGRTFKESFQKALRGLEVGSFGFGCDAKDRWGTADEPARDEIRAKLSTPCEDRVWFVRYALKSGMTVDEIHGLTHIDPWFLEHLREIVGLEEILRGHETIATVSDELLRQAKQYGFADRQLATLWSTNEIAVRTERKQRGIVATFKSVDTCAAEFEAYTPYFYSTYEDEDETPKKEPGTRRIMILGGGPNRIGQGIEFDYCCCHASFALREMGIESIMVNSNPETVSTDYDTSDLLFFEPLTMEDVLNICDRTQPDGVIVQLGGQTPLNLARALASAGVPIIGTSVDTIEDAEDRERFQQLLHRLGLRQPANGIARTLS
ncbi:MAG: carbamoyl-phosphate synthase large subunit [Planctomycetes bacterium]|nr:carbamoyl-phosphate synthase large subunit [Planctomycetota bacterium]